MKNLFYKKLFIYSVMLLAMFFVLTKNAQAATSVTQYGIIWTFDADYTVGQFVNGDYWVVGPIVINAITPNYDFDLPVTTDACEYPSIATCTSYSSSSYGVSCPKITGQDVCVYLKAKNGWMVNPTDPLIQGFDGSVGSFDKNSVPTLPYLAHAN